MTCSAATSRAVEQAKLNDARPRCLQAQCPTEQQRIGQGRASVKQRNLSSQGRGAGSSSSVASAGCWDCTRASVAARAQVIAVRSELAQAVEPGCTLVMVGLRARVHRGRVGGEMAVTPGEACARVSARDAWADGAAG